MQDLARSRLPRDWPAIRFHPGDLDWWVVGIYGRTPGMSERVRLWFEPGGGERGAPGPGGDGELVAYGWFGPPTDLDFLVGPDEPDVVAALLGEIVGWADAQRQALSEAPVGPLRVWASAADESAVAGLQALGLEREDKPGFVHFTGDLDVADGWPAPSMPGGLTSRTLSDADVPARVVCGHAAFPGSTQTEERYRTVADSWLYRRDLDRVIVTDDGRVVAFALAWYDPVTQVAELEPVGVHPEWHRKGLGGEVCRAALRAARDLGATRAVIAADRDNPAALALYTSLGLSITTDVLPFTRPAAPTGAATDAPRSKPA
jgi:ribosomal protein S18 acetylase RimI-like enzyme